MFYPFQRILVANRRLRRNGRFGLPWLDPYQETVVGLLAKADADEAPFRNKNVFSTGTRMSRMYQLIYGFFNKPGLR